MSIGLCLSAISLLVISGMSSSFLRQLDIIQDDQPSLFVLNVLREDVPYIQANYDDPMLFDTILARIQSINTTPLTEHLASRTD
jgi:hypothetical protein